MKNKFCISDVLFCDKNYFMSTHAMRFALRVKLICENFVRAKCFDCKMLYSSLYLFVYLLSDEEENLNSVSGSDIYSESN